MFKSNVDKNSLSLRAVLAVSTASYTAVQTINGRRKTNDRQLHLFESLRL